MIHKEENSVMDAVNKEVEKIVSNEIEKQEKAYFESMKKRGDFKEAAFLVNPDMVEKIDAIFNILGFSFPVVFSTAVEKDKIYIPTNKQIYDNLVGFSKYGK